MDQEFEITYLTSDVVVSGEMPQKRPTLQDAAIYGLERLLDDAGPDIFEVDVRDEQGISHRFAVYRWHGKWVCENRVPSRSFRRPRTTENPSQRSD